METTNLPNLKINVLTPEQYEAAEKSTNEIYLIGNDTTFLSTVTKEYVDNSKVTVDTALSTSSANPVANNAVAAALDTKQPTITGAASTITDSNLTASRVLVSNSSGKIAASSNITTTELGYLNGVTSAIQTQINNKANSSHTQTANTITDFNTAVQSAVASLGNAKVAYGTYTGANSAEGSSYSDTPTTITLPFEPVMVILVSQYKNESYSGGTTDYFNIALGVNGTISVPYHTSGYGSTSIGSWSGTTLTLNKKSFNYSTGKAAWIIFA